MRRALLHLLAWSLATGAAVTLSWWGVRTVMAGTVYDPPRALPVRAAGHAAAATEEPLTSSTWRAASWSPTAPGPARSTPGPGPQDRAAAPSPAPSAASSPLVDAAGSTGTVRSFDTQGGHVVFDLGRSSATLVSATPGDGWSMRVRTTGNWIRVEFSSTESSQVTVLCSWHGGPPQVTVGEL